MEHQNPIALVVEDDMITQLVLKRQFAKANFTNIAFVTNAEDAFKVIDKNPALKFALLDIVIEGKLDEIDIAMEIRKRNLTLPFIFASANTDAATKTRADALEPDNFIPKPYDVDNLIAMLIEKYLR